MPAGSSPKREREYSHLKTEFKKSHRYPGREEEVAARIVNKQRKEAGETQDSNTSHAKSNASIRSKKTAAKKSAKKLPKQLH